MIHSIQMIYLTQCIILFPRYKCFTKIVQDFKLSFFKNNNAFKSVQFHSINAQEVAKTI